MRKFFGLSLLLFSAHAWCAGDEKLVGKWSASVVEDLSEIMDDSGYTLTLSIKETTEFFADGTRLYSGVVQYKMGGKSSMTLSTHSFAGVSRYKVDGKRFLEMPEKCLVHEEQTIPSKGNLVELRKTLDEILDGICDTTPETSILTRTGRDKFSLSSDGVAVEYTRIK